MAFAARFLIPGWLTATLMGFFGWFFGASLSNAYCYWEALRFDSELARGMHQYVPEAAPYHWATVVGAGGWLVVWLLFMKGRRSPRSLAVGLFPLGLLLFGAWWGLGSGGTLLVLTGGQTAPSSPLCDTVRRLRGRPAARP